MRFAVIADIHANCVALDAVLDDLAGDQYDELICLGDISKPGPQPKECLDRIRELRCPVVMGNNDAWFIHYRENREKFENPTLIAEIDIWCADKLTDADIDFMRSFPATIEYPIEKGFSILYYHASPRDNAENIFSTTSDDDLGLMIEDRNATVLVGGHTHMQMLRRKGAKTIVNAGSVGRPFLREHFDRPPPYVIPPVAEYAMIDYTQGRLSVDFRQIPISLEKFKQIAFASGMPHAKWLLSHHVDRETYVSELLSSKSSSGE